MALKFSSSEVTSDATRSDRERFPQLFRQGPMIDRHKARRVVPMRVFVFGFPRTGTASVHVALSHMGFDEIYHMASVFHNADDAQWWLRAGDAKWRNKGTFTREDWDKLLGHCQAACDLPAAAFAEELIAAYPEAKVVILNRDVDKWYTSMSQTILKNTKPTPWSLLRGFLDWRESGQLGKMIGQQLRDMFPVSSGGLTATNMKKVFVEYHERLRKVVPKERLLEYKVQDGYKPLCEFLEVRVPTLLADGEEIDEPFPRVNDAATFDDSFAVLRKLQNRRILKKAGKALSVFALVGASLWYYLPRS